VSNFNLQQNAVADLAAQAEAVGSLAKDTGGFAAAVAAFESQDPDALRWVLQRLELLPHCEPICEWIRVKLCVLRCWRLCGPLNPNTEFPGLPQFAQAIVQLGSNEQLLRRIVDAVSCGDAEIYQSAIAEAKLQPFCHLICRYVCYVLYRRVCEVVCSGRPVPLTDAALDIRADAEELRGVLANNRSLADIVKAAEAFDCEILQSAISRGQLVAHCEIICRLICVWRCVRVCRTLCQRIPPILVGREAIEEAGEFALAARKLSSDARALSDLVGAVMREDSAAYGAIVERFGLSVYCWQVCAWICSEVCHLFCICVCPPTLVPLFTAIGGYDYDADIDSVLPATGLTNSDTRAFFSTMRLNGVLTQTYDGAPLEYMFEYQPIAVATTTLAAAITAAAVSITVTSGASFPAPPFDAVIGGANGGYEIVRVTAVAATTWTVLRGQHGTAALAAAMGASVTTGASASGGWTQIPKEWIDHTVIGIQEIPQPFPHPPLHKNIAVHAGASELDAPFTADGWIQTPQGPLIFLNGNMINLISTKLPSFPLADETGVSAGNPANHPLPTAHCFGLRMRVRKGGSGSATGDEGGTCQVVAINNTLYHNVNHHPEWDGGVLGDEYAVYMVDIQELQANGCGGISNSLTVLFTASHANLGAVSVQMIGPGGPYPFTLPTPVPETGDWYGVATPQGWSLANLPDCAYIVQLSVDLLLTTGDQSFGPPRIDQIAFCLRKRAG